MRWAKAVFPGPFVRAMRTIRGDSVTLVMRTCYDLEALPETASEAIRYSSRTVLCRGLVRVSRTRWSSRRRVTTDAGRGPAEAYLLLLPVPDCGGVLPGYWVTRICSPALL